MLTLHIGMPKTGTTAIQSFLSDNEHQLLTRNVLYPAFWRDGEGIAHHDLGMKLLRDTDAAIGNVADEVIEFAKSNKSARIIISSESMTNMLNSKKIDRLKSLIQGIEEVTPVCLVLCARRMDEFLESMYLHSVKVGDVSASVQDYVAVRERWVEEFFECLLYLRLRKVPARIRVIPYVKNDKFVPNVLRVMGVPADMEIDTSPYRSVNSKLGLKGQSVLLHLADVENKLDIKINRKKLVKSFESGQLRFSEDAGSYHVFPYYISKYFHELALRAALETHQLDYYESFRSHRIQHYEHRELGLDALVDDDYEKLREWARAHLQEPVSA